ncbi:SRPBCC family protein [Nocardia sp. NBC_01329]|uniref:SRPBCC family protein n=1 Tax=Nocardia sp. NBC_01329 TaxID=2903594 RepID=UPI002E0F26F2|nr:SRPBCC family protein [Nocardia sp. NBC_01329]
MSARFPLSPSDDAFLDTAPHRYTHIVDIPASVPQVWDTLVAPDALVSWSPVITAATWTSPRPFGIGTTRDVTLGGLLRLEERFYRWDEGSRMTFTVDAASVPGLKRFAEDITLLPLGTGARIIWTFALEGTAALRLPLAAAGPINRFVTKTIAGGTSRRVRTQTVGTR